VKFTYTYAFRQIADRKLLIQGDEDKLHKLLNTKPCRK